ncbi:MAG: hypothetical protein AAB370_08320, partial [Verrucomicrobiota bacterium]
EIGGRGAGQMIALFRAGLDQQYQDLQVMTGAQADVLDEAEDKWSSLWQTIKIFTAHGLVNLIDGLRWLQAQAEMTVEGFASAWRWFQGQVGKGGPKGDPVGDAKGLWEAFKKGVQEASDEIDERNTQEENDRKDRVAKRLQFGASNFDHIQEKEQKQREEKFSLAELKLDQLSQAGLFAGGAGSGMMNNIPSRQLAAMEKIAGNTSKTNNILEDSF